MPEWNIPTDLRSLIDPANDYTWGSNDWAPIMLTVFGGARYAGREIDLTWQIEYETIGCAGYEFCDRVMANVESHDAELMPLLNCGDTESAVCVIWVETEEACRRLLEIAWPMAT